MGPLSKFEKLEKISEGGMGVVYRAWDPMLNRPLAIKFVRLSGDSNSQEREEFEARLKREAQAAGNLSHPNIVTIYNLIQQNDTAYIEMEFVDGQSLQAWMGECDVLGPHVVLDIIRQSATALDYAHSKGVVHRDVKPSNILLSNDGLVKLVDFGLAKVATASKLTRTGSAIGTPHYMSAEQIDGDVVEPRSDQYSLAVCAYEMISGARPFTGESLQSLFNRILNTAPPPASQLNDSLGPEIDAVLAKALSKKPQERYGKCMEFASALERACALRPAWRPKVAPQPAKAKAAAQGGGGGVAVATQTPMPTPAEMERVVKGLDPWLTEAISPRPAPRPVTPPPAPPVLSTPRPTPAPTPMPTPLPIYAPIASPPRNRLALIGGAVAAIALLGYGLFAWIGAKGDTPPPKAVPPPVLAQPAPQSTSIVPPAKEPPKKKPPVAARPQPLHQKKTPAKAAEVQPSASSEPDKPADVGSKPVRLAPLPKKK